MIGDGKAVGGADSSSVQWGDIDIESTHSSSSRSAEIVRDEKVTAVGLLLSGLVGASGGAGRYQAEGVVFLVATAMAALRGCA